MAEDKRKELSAEERRKIGSSESRLPKRHKSTEKTRKRQ